MTWWAKVSIALLSFAAVVFLIAGIIDRSWSELALGALSVFLAASTYKSAPRRHTPRT